MKKEGLWELVTYRLLNHCIQNVIKIGLFGSQKDKKINNRNVNVIFYNLIGNQKHSHNLTLIKGNIFIVCFQKLEVIVINKSSVINSKRGSKERYLQKYKSISKGYKQFKTVFKFKLATFWHISE